MWFIGVEVEQETSAPPPKKNPGSALGTCNCCFCTVLGLKIFHKISPRTHNNYLQQNHCYDMSSGCCLLLELNLWPQKWCRYDLPYRNIENHVSTALTEHLLKNSKLPKLCVGRLCSVKQNVGF